MTGSQQALSDLRERRRCPLRRLLDNLGRGGSRQSRGVSAASAPKAHGGFAALPQGNATTESPRSPPAPEEHPAEGAQIGNATTESPRGAALEEHPAEDVDVASAAVDAGVMPATVHADGAKATEPGAPSEVSADDATVNAAPPETIPDTSNGGGYLPESPRCCRSPWAPCGSRGERPTGSRGRHAPSEAPEAVRAERADRCAVIQEATAFGRAQSALPDEAVQEAIPDEAAPEAIPETLSEDAAEIPCSLPGVALGAPQGAPEMSQSSSRRRQRHLRRRARKMALRAAP